MKDILNDIREKTEGMSRQDKVSYILTYYWYHMLIIFSVLALIVIFIVHYATYKKPEFTCVMVNQQIDTQRDNQMTEGFAKFSKMDPKRIEINSNYNFSYGDLKLADVNESSNEKFFLQWRNNELDAVIMSLGTSPNPLISSTTKGLDINKRKCIVAEEETGKTSKEGVYAGGDAVTGAATVILAMGAGKAGAKGIDEFLSNN